MMKKCKNHESSLFLSLAKILEKTFGGTELEDGVK